MTDAQHLTKIIWRGWYNESAVEKMTKDGTLEINEILIDTRGLDGEDVAAKIIGQLNDEDGSYDYDGADIVIVEPKEFAGDYEVSVDFEPVFRAFRR